jgi:sec-independent protein translocase protein TatB
MVHSQLERSLFDLNFFKIAVLALIALVVFGPDQLPKMASQAGRALRELRRMAEGARADLQEHLGPEFTDFDLNELNPKYFVRKHLLDEADGSATDGSATDGSATDGSAGWAGIGTRPAGEPPVSLLEPGESPPYDVEAT